MLQCYFDDKKGQKKQQQSKALAAMIGNQSTTSEMNISQQTVRVPKEQSTFYGNHPSYIMAKYESMKKTGKIGAIDKKI